MKISPARRRTAVVGVALAGVSMLAASCGEDEAAAADTVTVHATDYAFGDLPAEVEAGTKFEFVNDSHHELHEFVAVRIPDGETRSAGQLAADPNLESLFTGPPAFVLLAAPGGEQIAAVGDGTVTEPGRYLVVCMIPTGADPEEFLAAAESEDGPPALENAGPPHIVQGMYGEFTVTD
jgi:plastocyanin